MLNIWVWPGITQHYVKHKAAAQEQRTSAWSRAGRSKWLPRPSKLVILRHATSSSSAISFAVALHPDFCHLLLTPGHQKFCTQSPSLSSAIVWERAATSCSVIYNVCVMSSSVMIYNPQTNNQWWYTIYGLTRLSCYRHIALWVLGTNREANMCQ